jgi:uncharacterized protein YndB with AHSA1/START domain
MSWTHEHTFKLAAPPERVYRALTDPTELMAWFAESVEIGNATGEAFRFWGRHTPGTPSAIEANQQITAHEPGRLLAFTWTLHGVPTEVRLALSADGDTAQVVLHHRVDGELPMARPRELVDDFWRLSFGNLMQHLAGNAVVRPDFADPAPEVRVVMEIAATPEEVWQSLITPSAVNQWFNTKAAEIDPRVGGAYKVGWRYTIDGRDVVGGPTTILEYDPPRRLVLDWPDWRGDPEVSGQTIAFELAPKGTGTTLTFVHTGFTRAEDISDYPFGWAWFLGELVRVTTAPSAAG